MSHSRTRLGTVIAALALTVLAAGCTPAQVAWWSDPSVPQEQKDAVLAAMRKPAPSGDCVEAMHQVWPASTWGWAMSIMKRESGYNPSAKNRSSSASGCWQLLSMHAHRVPGGWGNVFNAHANNVAAYSLYREAGTSPWRL
jgi:hypothetical protein